MSLRFLELERFRNFPELALELDPRGGILEAPNGHGKTSFLEAIHYLGLFRSFRGAPDSELVTFGERGFRIRGEIEVADGSRRQVGVAVEGTRKRVALDGREGRRSAGAGAVASVVLCPDDIRLIQGGPARRRRYLDLVLALSSPRYLRSLQEYGRALRQRNRLLQTGPGRRLLEPWTQQVVHHGSAILFDRLRFLDRWQERFAEISARLAGSSEGALSWRYESSALGKASAEVATAASELAATRTATPETGPMAEPVFGGGWGPDASEAASLEGLAERLRDELHRRAAVERARGMTLAGPHRDDLSVRIGRGRDLLRFGSQGEQRTAALALRFLESEALTEERRELPIALLDDVFSELDPVRSRQVLAFLVPGQQVFLTTPKPLAGALSPDLPRYGVEDGRVRLAG